jgi:hypothetical protein
MLQRFDSGCNELKLESLECSKNVNCDNSMLIMVILVVRLGIEKGDTKHIFPTHFLHILMLLKTKWRQANKSCIMHAKIRMILTHCSSFGYFTL